MAGNESKTTKEEEKPEDEEAIQNYDEQIRSKIRDNIKGLDDIVASSFKSKEDVLARSEIMILQKNFDLFNVSKQLERLTLQ